MFTHIATQFLFTTFVLVVEPPALINSGFEKTKENGDLEGWHCPPATRETYAARACTDDPRKGKRCALIESTTTENVRAFGNLMQSLPAGEFRNKRITFSAYARADVVGVGSQGRMWLRVDCAGNRMGFFDNQANGPVIHNEWKRFYITGDIDADAENIALGFMLHGFGKLWIDSASLKIIGNAGEGIEAPRPITPRGIENVTAFTRLFGYVRHFHPSDEAAKADWEQIAIEGTRAVESAKDARELASALSRHFRPVAPTLRVFATGDQAPPMPALTPPANTESLWIKQWKHTGYGQAGDMQAIYNSRRTEQDAPDGKPPAGYADPQSPLQVELPGGVTCLIPVALWGDDDGTLPHAARSKSTAKNESTDDPPAFTARDRATRLADVAITWNIMQHFYPYFDVVQTDWNTALTEALSTAATDKDDAAFIKTLRRLIHHLHDGHGFVSGPGDAGHATLPVAWTWVGKQLVIAAVDVDSKDNLKPGDVVLAMNGIEVSAVAEDLGRYISAATPQWRDQRLLHAMSSGADGESVRLRVSRDGGKTFNITLKRGMRQAPVVGQRPDPICEVKPGIWYVDIDRATEQHFGESTSALSEARGIVFDLRGYPSRITPGTVLACTIDQKITSARWNIPAIRMPDRQDWKWNRSDWSIMPGATRFKAKMAYLTGGGAISAAETWMGMVENYKIAPIIGGPTAGTNGNVNPIKLPGGYTISWTGMKVLKHDGSRHHGVGILPTIPMERTIKGIAAGRDEVLERGIEEVSR